jgi:hypothetical protein
MDQLRDDKLRAYSVWVPILLTDAERAVPNATKLLPDNRVMHFWDGKGELVEAYKAILPTKNAETGEYVKAWAVYLIFAGRRMEGSTTCAKLLDASTVLGRSEERVRQ